MQCCSPIAEAPLIRPNAPSDPKRGFSHSQLSPAPLRLKHQPRNLDNETSHSQVMDTLEESLNRDVAAPLVGRGDTGQHDKRVRPVEPSSSTDPSCASDIASIISKFEVLQVTSTTMSRSPTSTQPPSCPQPAFFVADPSYNPRQAIRISAKDAARNETNASGLGVTDGGLNETRELKAIVTPYSATSHPVGERASKDNHGYQTCEAVPSEDLTIGMQQGGSSLPATSTKAKQNITRTEHPGRIERVDRSSAWDSKLFAERRMRFEEYLGRYFLDVLVVTYNNPRRFF